MREEVISEDLLNLLETISKKRRREECELFDRPKKILEICYTIGFRRLIFKFNPWGLCLHIEIRLLDSDISRLKIRIYTSRVERGF